MVTSFRAQCALDLRVLPHREVARHKTERILRQGHKTERRLCQGHRIERRLYQGHRIGSCQRPRTFRLKAGRLLCHNCNIPRTFPHKLERILYHSQERTLPKAERIVHPKGVKLKPGHHVQVKSFVPSILYGCHW